MSPQIQVIFFILIQAKFLVGDLTIELPNGKILGHEKLTFDDTPYYAFEGIPYAAPPIGPLRFKAPQPPQNWENVLNATLKEVTCFQTSSNTELESEDCLYINVYVPQFGDSLPVMVNMYGGGFIDGDYLFYKPELFMSYGVIFVSFNYRVGPFGFLSTQDETIPGNNGLKDQQLAIQWVHKNIELFGGDPDKVTIFGESAGSASCAYQLLNQKNKGLFQAAILQSGSFLSPWAFQRRAREIAFKTASFLNFEDSDDSQILLDFLQNVDARDLDAAAEQYHDFENGPRDIEISQGFYWAPVVEVENDGAFLTRNMYGLLKNKDILAVPVIMGMTSEEGLLFNPDSESFKSTMEAFDSNLDWLVPNDMQILNDSQKVEMGGLIRDLYTGGEPLADHLGDGIRFSSDNSFTRSIIKHAEIYSKISQTYFYQFSYDGEMGEGDIHYQGADNVGHSEDILYFFCLDICDDPNYPESDHLTRRRLLKLWTEFAKYHDPTPEISDLLQNVTWPQLSTKEGDFYYLDIDEDLGVRNWPREKEYKRWNELYDSLSFDDFDTY